MNILSIGIRRWLGLALCGLPAVVFSGWLMGNEKILKLMSGTAAMSLTAALLFILAGACLLGSYRSNWSRNVLRFFSVVLIVVPSLILAERVFKVDYGFDLMKSLPLASGARLQTGRLPPDICVALLLAGMVFLLNSMHVQKRRVRQLIRLLIIAVLLIGGSSLFGYMLNLETLYHVAGFNRSAAPSALGVCLLGLGLWFFVGDAISSPPGNLENEDRRITSIAAVLLTVLAVVAGLTGFAVLQQGYEQSTADHIRNTASQNAVVISNMLDHASQLAKSIASRPALKKNLALLNTDIQNAEALAFVGEVGRTFLPLGFTGIEFYTAKGNYLLTTGVMVAQQASIVVRLKSVRGVGETETLFWQDGFVLRSENDAVLNGNIVGRVVAEQRLSAVSSLVKELQSGGASDDACMCTREGLDAVCFPTRFYPANMHIPLFRRDDNTKSPIGRALSGESGAVAVTELKGNTVLAAFAPVGDHGLGLVLKTDLREQYALLRKQFNLLGVLLALLVIFGTLVLRKQLQPLVGHILQEQKRMKLILENSTDAFVMVGENGKIRDWNTQAERSFGWARDEVLGKRLLELIIPPSQLDTVVARIKHLEDDGNTRGTVVHSRVEIDTLHKTGRLVPMEISFASLYDAGGYAGHVFLRDISERRKVDALKDEFVSTVSHELRTPLTSIHGSLSLVLGGVTGEVSGKTHQLLTIAHRNSDRLIRLINDILDIEKIESGNMSFVFQNCSLPQLMQQGLELSAFYGQQYGVQFELIQPVPDVMVNVDQDRLIQVMINLLSNAAKFSHAAGTVEVAAQVLNSKTESTTGRMVRIIVTDYGCGIAAGSHDKIFQKFSQVDGSDQRKKGGTGLGLSISRSIVEQMSGRMGFESTLDIGSSFYFELPVVDEGLP
ncbi:sensor histidine kinase [Undibacterium sp.]|uniref:sensor histidine kinase n=1 Tax=Undibacterium sp. TaxID=1914977 RepID=UPI002CD7E698|nr:ATP-binding protein [Undibacterium sp.]HTD05772.1 ATP-binding protein [Undibacterium sp.]